ncbi:MAG: hypothetical protein RIK87_16400 [Fuerstiella sp.]
MPTTLQEIISTKQAVAVYDITVLTIDRGTVVPKDLKIEFPPGTKVIDAIEGLAYTIVDGGKRIDTAPLMVGAAFTRASVPRPLRQIPTAG